MFNLIRLRWRSKESKNLHLGSTLVLLIIIALVSFIPSPIADWIDENEWVTGAWLVWLVLGSSVTDYYYAQTHKERKEIIADVMTGWLILGVLALLLYFFA